MQQTRSLQRARFSERLLFGGLGLGLLLLSRGQSGQTRVLLGIGGALLLVGAVRGRGVGGSPQGLLRAPEDTITISKAVTIGLPPEELYAFWRPLKSLPRFMDHLESVTLQGDGRSHWVAKGPAGSHVKWDAEMTEDVPGRRLAWRSLEGSQIHNEGQVDFRAAPGDRGTEVQVTLTYRPPAGRLGASVARLLGEEPAVQIGEDLRRLKRLLEVGELPTTEGQSSGRQTPLGKLAAKMYDNARTS